MRLFCIVNIGPHVSRKWTCAKPNLSSAGVMSRLEVLNFACSELHCSAAQDLWCWLLLAAWRHDRIIHASSNPLLLFMKSRLSSIFQNTTRQEPASTEFSINSFFSPCTFRSLRRTRAVRESCKLVWFAQISIGWWFGTFFIFPYIGNNHPNWLIFFRGVQTTNQSSLVHWYRVTSRDYGAGWYH